MENKYGLPNDHLFTYDEIISLLNKCMGTCMHLTYITVDAKDYAKFYLKSYELHEFNDEDINRLQSD